MDSLRSRLSNDALLGTFLKLPRREVVELAVIAGFDFLICDMEHGQLHERDAAHLVLAANAVDAPMVVRVPDANPGVINRLLEAGAAGIQVPHVTSRRTAAAGRSATRYPPDGTRSGSLAQPAAQYGTQGRLADYLRASNDRALCIGQLETKDYDDDLESVVAELDVAFIGTFDLTLECGAPGDASDPEVAAVIDRIETAARTTQTPLGVYAASPQAATTAFQTGYRMVALDSDLGALGRGLRDLVAAIDR